MLGVMAVFCYVGAEVGIVSFMIRYAKSLQISGLTEQKSALFITVFMALVLSGRVLGAVLLKSYKSSFVLIFSALGAFVLLVAAVVSAGYFSLWALSIIGLFTSVMYPVLFTMSIRNLGVYTKTASSLLIMGIVGGAVVPPIMGQISDLSGIRTAFIVPMICYVYILFYSVKGHIIRQQSENQ